MTRTVSLITGTHTTATDKRNILAGIDDLRETFAPFIAASPETTPNYAATRLKRKGSPKSYAIAPCPTQQGVYCVTIHSNETNSYGMPMHRATTVTVKVDGEEPLYLPCYAKSGEAA
jgi:hypothetical protein